MSPTLFISDLHLSETRPDITEALLAFLGGPARDAGHVYVLGDLFDFWVGDDTLDEPLNATVVSAMRQLTDSGVPLSVMHGNRDFLLGPAFASATGARLVPDPLHVDLHGAPSLLLHGDTLCTDDVAYQAFRRHVRDPGVQRQFLAMPLEARRAQVGQVRASSEREKREKAMVIMDVSPDTVSATFRDHGFARMIHGHTHRPARHEHVVDGHLCERWVLSDWETRAEYLRADAGGCTRIPVTIPG
ncbi:MAG: UDP-2,3-diacylglucosamine diphosphatase [Betaproteobacteria bacterium]|nr:UDP-2,3-diacylglucosamine diphosphatase [Betaproteobacteria bacterium]